SFASTGNAPRPQMHVWLKYSFERSKDGRNGAEPQPMAHNRLGFLFTLSSHVEQASGARAERPRRVDSLSYASRGRDSDAAADLAHIDAPHRNPQCFSRPPAVLDSGGDDRRLTEAARSPSGGLNR